MGGFLEWLDTILAVIGDALETAFTFVVDALETAGAVVWDTLSAVGSAVWEGINAVGGGVTWLWDNAIYPALDAIGTFITEIPQYLQDFFADLPGWIESVTDWLHWAWANVLSPIFAVLNISQDVLGLLAKLGVKWAQALDDVLYEIESKLYAAWSFVSGKVNDIAGVVALFTDPRGIFQRAPFLWTVASLARDFIKVVADLGLANTPAAPGVPTPQAAQALAMADFEGGTFPDNDAMNAALADWDDYTASGIGL